MIDILKNALSDRNPLRLMYHKLKAILAAIIYGFPANNLIVIGVTGTNGKTTTVNLIAHSLTKIGEKVAMSSTINFQIGERKWINALKKTTLSPFKLQKFLREAVDNGCKYAVLEVSSHALTQARIWGINFDIAAYTNVTPEHIEYHGSFADYLHAKGKLFSIVSKGKRKKMIDKVLILNRDEENFEYFDRFYADRKFSYGLKGGVVSVKDLNLRAEGSDFLVNVPNDSFKVDFKLPGDFNVANALAATSVLLALNFSGKQIKEALDSVQGVKGRYDHVKISDDFDVVVDYAHTPDALENLFALYKRLAKGRLIVVFGATGGGRDKSKRPKMGEIADKYADEIILTNDDPYEEDEWAIINQIAQAINREEMKQGFWKIRDRYEAIKFALEMVKKGDVIVIAGKGAEETIMLKGGAQPWNDEEVVREIYGKLKKI